VGNPKAGWKWPREQVIASIDAKSNNFFVIDPGNGKRSDIGVAAQLVAHHFYGLMRTATGTTTCCPSINAPYDGCLLRPTGMTVGRNVMES
jgi:hypothetical protein